MSERKGGLRPEAYEEIPGDQYEPYIPASEAPLEFSWKAIILGSLFGIAFGAANAYLGLRVGLTISTSIPIAVMTVAVFALLKPILGPATLLESNMAKTVGSASSSLASGIIFTVPAIWLWGLAPNYVQVSLLAAIGGCLGVAFMVPLRRYLINEEHGKLPYPEGTASAEVLLAAQEGGRSARNVFTGMGIAIVYSFFWKALQLWRSEIAWRLPFVKKAQLSLETSPALLGVGYILGFKIATIMVCGAALSYLIIMPVIAHLWGSQVIPPAETIVDSLSLSEMRNFYIRYIGAGAVASAGIITLIKSIPTMIKSFRIGLAKMKGAAAGLEEKRTDRDLSLKTVGLVALAALLLITALPFLFPAIDPWNFLLRLGIGVLVVVFAFFFVTVSARIVGLVGVTSNPTSGMIIATLICVSTIFALGGWTDATGKVTIIVIGTMVGVAASIAGDTSQDLKTGFLLGATPSRQQVGEMIGVLATAFFVTGSVFLLASQYEIGGPELGAPQANMMKLVVDGIIDQSIPWSLVLVGVGITLVIFLLRLPTLAFAVGVYLPLSTMTPIFVGGLIRRIVERRSAHDKGLLQQRRESGILFGSGLVGGEGLMGVGIAAYAFFAGRPTPVLPGLLAWLEPYPQHLLNALPMALLVWLLWRAIHAGEEPGGGRTGEGTAGA
jgi:putative OPT family oligopeptide transporter